MAIINQDRPMYLQLLFQHIITNRIRVLLESQDQRITGDGDHNSQAKPESSP